jgi:hypothetical protein
MHYKDLQNNIHFLDSTEFEHLLPVGCVQITDDEAETIRLSKVVPPTYSELRAAAYPPIVDQLDSIFHRGLDAWKAEIQAVKTQFPKEVA